MSRSTLSKTLARLRGISRLSHTLAHRPIEGTSLLQALDLREVTLVGNDTGHFQLTAGLYPERIARLVLPPCEAFENFPPGLPGRTAELGIKLPGGTFLLAQALRWHALRRLPFTIAWMAKRPIPNELIDAWLHSLQTQPGVRDDLSKYLISPCLFPQNILYYH